MTQPSPSPLPLNSKPTMTNVNLTLPTLALPSSSSMSSISYIFHKTASEMTLALDSHPSTPPSSAISSSSTSSSSSQHLTPHENEQEHTHDTMRHRDDVDVVDPALEKHEREKEKEEQKNQDTDRHFTKWNPNVPPRTKQKQDEEDDEEEHEGDEEDEEVMDSSMIHQDELRRIYLQSVHTLKLEGKLGPRERWEHAISSVIRIVRALLTFRPHATPPSSAANTANFMFPFGTIHVTSGAPSLTSTKKTGERTTTTHSQGTGNPLAPPSLLEFRLSDYTRSRGLLITSEMCKELDKPHPYYTEKNIDLIRKITERLESFQKYQPEVREKLLRSLQYCCYKPGRVIIKEGHEPKSFYFILSGTAQVYRTENGVRLPLSELQPGDSFGEVALMKNTRRTASVACKSMVEVFSLDKEDFLEVLRSTTEEDQSQKLEFFKSIPFLTDQPSSALLRIAEVCVKQERGPNVVLLREKDVVSDIYVIKKGSVRLVKILPFFKVAQGGGKFILTPAPSVPTVLPSSSTSSCSSSNLASEKIKVVYKLVCVGTLGPGQFFGQECLMDLDPHAEKKQQATAQAAALALSTTHGPTSHSNTSNATAASNALGTTFSNSLSKKNCLPPLTTSSTTSSAVHPNVNPPSTSFRSSQLHLPSHPSTSSPSISTSHSQMSLSASSSLTSSTSSNTNFVAHSVYSVITCEHTEIFKVSKIDFVKLVPPHHLMTLLDPPTFVPLHQLQLGYIETLRWMHWKTSVLKQLARETVWKRQQRSPWFAFSPSTTSSTSSSSSSSGSSGLSSTSAPTSASSFAFKKKKRRDSNVSSMKSSSVVTSSKPIRHSTTKLPVRSPTSWIPPKKKHPPQVVKLKSSSTTTMTIQGSSPPPSLTKSMKRNGIGSGGDGGQEPERVRNDMKKFTTMDPALTSKQKRE